MKCLSSASRFVIGGTLCFSLCSNVALSFEEMKVSRELAPMDKPAEPAEGYTWHVVKKGKEIMHTVSAVDGEKVSWETDDGCVYTEVNWGFAPSLDWINCKPWKDGSQTITKTKGSIWPLRVKNKIKYSYSGKYTRGVDTWKETRSCKVEKQVRVRVPAGEFDTYRVKCKQSGGNNRTWWISPELEEAVAFKNKHGLSELLVKP